MSCLAMGGSIRSLAIILLAEVHQSQDFYLSALQKRQSCSSPCQQRSQMHQCLSKTCVWIWRTAVVQWEMLMQLNNIFMKLQINTCLINLEKDLKALQTWCVSPIWFGVTNLVHDGFWNSHSIDLDNVHPTWSKWQTIKPQSHLSFAIYLVAIWDMRLVLLSLELALLCLELCYAPDSLFITHNRFVEAEIHHSIGPSPFVSSAIRNSDPERLLTLELGRFCRNTSFSWK